MLRLLENGEQVGSYLFEGYWLDIGRHEDYERAIREYESLKAELAAGRRAGPRVSPGVAGRPVLVTGGGGFIGGHLCAALVAEGARVRALVRYNSRNDRGTLEWLPGDIADEIEVVLGDLRDPESVAAAVAGTQVVFHLGAQIAIPYSYVNPRDFFETNVLGTFNVAQAALAHDVDAPRAHLDQRGLRQRPDGADHRGPPARGAVALRGKQDRRATS